MHLIDLADVRTPSVLSAAGLAAPQSGQLIWLERPPFVSEFFGPPYAAPDQRGDRHRPFPDGTRTRLVASHHVW